MSDTSRVQRSRSNSNQSGSGRSWWRWRSRAPANPPEAEQPSWGLRLERFCTQVSSVLPAVSSASGKAIVLLVLLVLGWKLLLWALEIIITGFCFVIAVCILFSFIRPDIAFKFATEVLPPKIDQARLWLSKLLLDIGEGLRGRSGTPSPALDIVHPSTSSAPRRTRSIHSHSRARSEGSIIYSHA